MTDKEKRLKLRQNEVVQAETFELAAKVCETAHLLGEKWLDGKSYLENISYYEHMGDTCYSLHEKGFSRLTFFLLQGYKVISAEEWLNRHGIFVHGQVVNSERGIMIYAGPENQCIDHAQFNAYDNGGEYACLPCKKVESPYPEFKEVEPLEIDGKKYDKEAVKALIEKSKNIKEL